MMGLKQSMGLTAAPAHGANTPDVAAKAAVTPSSATRGAASLANDLFGRFSRKSPNGVLEGYTLLVLGAKAECLQYFRGWMTDMGGVTIRVQKHEEALTWLKRNSTAKAMLLVNADALEDVDALCDIGFALRAAAPDLPVIVTSSSVAASDFSTLRMQLCDVTLKAPASESSFKQACQAALINNAFYMERKTGPVKMAKTARTHRAPLVLGDKDRSRGGWKSALTLVSVCLAYVAFFQGSSS
ncbi:hypothetical protein [Roseicitreum antarcticum]|uniref:Uncharacterized protein n=1 Tax=Roseicitreum antarcticum TaxID=564137 RepID=A0A1H2XVW5_9RHOB|nr:hypothetical protein [Roseicitreum antarcticum]SDW97033.1 hypothetical protein SAMN04488238_104330 [Roseicitreum antarcticum]